MTIIILNDLRVSNGKTPLKAWKESKAKLADAIAKEQVALEAKGMPSFTDIETGLDALNMSKAKAAVKKMYAPKKSATEKAASNSIANLARTLHIDPKQARAKVRRHHPDFIAADRTYLPADEQKVIDFLKSDSRKK